jgi:hypothetical protein
MIKASVLLLVAMLGGSTSTVMNTAPAPHIIKVSGTVETLKTRADETPGYEIRFDRPTNISGRMVLNVEICRGGQCLKPLLNKRVTATGRISGMRGPESDNRQLMLLADIRERRPRQCAPGVPLP